jgi:hypothetical protein
MLTALILNSSPSTYLQDRVAWAKSPGGVWFGALVSGEYICFINYNLTLQSTSDHDAPAIRTAIAVIWGKARAAV